jgi:hypothetical protein
MTARRKGRPPWFFAAMSWGFYGAVWVLGNPHELWWLPVTLILTLSSWAFLIVCIQKEGWGS